MAEAAKTAAAKSKGPPATNKAPLRTNKPLKEEVWAPPLSEEVSPDIERIPELARPHPPDSRPLESCPSGQRLKQAAAELPLDLSPKTCEASRMLSDSGRTCQVAHIIHCPGSAVTGDNDP